jgi:hypothetical protein
MCQSDNGCPQPPIDSNFKHAYLAAQQGTKYAVIAVHSVEKKTEFTKMMQTLGQRESDAK